ncbi:MAG: gliding motility-associated C-terminal domain-containing protein [Flavobacteriales bacterium]
MRFSSILLTLVFMVIGCNSSIGQTPFYYGPSACLNPQQKQLEDGKNSIWSEDIALRTTHTSTYTSNDGQIKTISSQRPLNYYNHNGDLFPIKKDLQSSSNGWTASEQPYPTYLFKDGSFALTLNDGKLLKMGSKCKLNGFDASPDIHKNGNLVTLKEIFTDVDKQLLFLENSVKYNYVLHSYQNAYSDELIFTEEIELPNGFSLVYNKDLGKETKNGWIGELNVLNDRGEHCSFIQAPICVDANNAWVLASYRIRKSGDHTYLDIVVPKEWLASTERVFPVIVDPIVTGPTSTWSSGNMPSCILPTVNKDSIQVTIPGGVTITGLFVTASFYADPFTTAIMSQGSMAFSTTCATSQNFTITGATGTSPGTAYLDSFNLFNPLTCCFPESCNTSTFWLRMHLGRTGPGTGCNTSFIRYDALTTLWPFQAVVVGKTAESFGGKWLVSQTPICSNSCTINGTAYVNYGVPPYTFTHPWTTDVFVDGSGNGCGSGAEAQQFTLNIPNCPTYCDLNTTELIVPPPVVTDACGNIVSDMPNKIVPIKPAPQVSAIYDTTVCSGTENTIELISCVPGSTINWNGSGGSGNITVTIENTTTNMLSTNFEAFASANGCYSDTTILPLNIQPNPVASYTANPIPIIANVPLELTDASTNSQATNIVWDWNLGDGNTSSDQSLSYLYSNPGEYEVCLKVTDDNNCIDSLCSILTVVPADVEIPNIITANGDGINDLLVFKYLEFYPSNELSILNRWGNTVFSAESYKNDWDGADLSEGIYFFLLKVPDINKEIQGFFHLER